MPSCLIAGGLTPSGKSNVPAIWYDPFLKKAPITNSVQAQPTNTNVMPMPLEWLHQEKTRQRSDIKLVLKGGADPWMVAATEEYTAQ
jgi:hypothetical protein